MANPYGLAQNAPAPAANPGDQLAMAVQRLEAVTSQFDELASRLCGNIPRDVGGVNSAVKGQSSYFDAIQDAADKVSMAADMINGGINRITARL